MIDALSASYIRQIGQWPVQEGLGEDGEFQAILQQIEQQIETLAPIEPVGALGQVLLSDLPSTTNTTCSVGEHEGPEVAPWGMPTDASAAVFYPQSGVNLSLQEVMPDQEQGMCDHLLCRPLHRPDPVVAPGHPGEEANHVTRLADVQQSVDIETLQQSAQLAGHPLAKPIRSSQEAIAPEPATESKTEPKTEPPADQHSQRTTQPAIVDTPLDRLAPASVRQPLPAHPLSGTQPNELTTTAPVNNCLMLGGNRHARAIAEFPGLGAVQVVMTRNNSEVTVNLQASKQSLPTLESCSPVLHRLISDSVQQMPIASNPVTDEPAGAMESGLKIALSLTTSDHGGSGRGRQHPWAGELAGEWAETSEFSADTDLVASAPQTAQQYRSSNTLPQHIGVALVDLHI